MGFAACKCNGICSLQMLFSAMLLIFIKHARRDLFARGSLMTDKECVASY